MYKGLNTESISENSPQEASWEPMSTVSLGVRVPLGKELDFILDLQNYCKEKNLLFTNFSFYH